jgi:hypothetical protein
VNRDDELYDVRHHVVHGPVWPLIVIVLVLAAATLEPLSLLICFEKPALLQRFPKAGV